MSQPYQRSQTPSDHRLLRYLLPNSVIQYIYDHKLYRGLDAKAITK